MNKMKNTLKSIILAGALAIGIAGCEKAGDEKANSEKAYYQNRIPVHITTENNQVYELWRLSPTGDEADNVNLIVNMDPIYPTQGTIIAYDPLAIGKNELQWRLPGLRLTSYDTHPMTPEQVEKATKALELEKQINTLLNESLSEPTPTK